MAVSFGHIRAVNPTSLAEVSGVTRIPGFARSPVPPVVRPDLLTSQLMGCHPCCQNCNGTHAGPAGNNGFASYIPPDYGHLHPTLRGNGEYGLFKMFSSQSAVPSGPGGGQNPGMPQQMQGLGKGEVSRYNANRSWAHGLRGFGKGEVSRLYANRSWAHGLRGLGQTPTSTGTQDADLQKTLNDILSIFRPGANEADAIVNQAQNPLMARLGTVTQQFVTGTNPSLAQLQSLYSQVANMWNSFKAFVLSPKFTDRRASGQALNTLGPVIDGTCGYAVPLGTVATPTQFNCGHWGDGTLGGDGTNGMLGALQRAISNQGGIASVFSSAGISGIGGINTTTLLLILAGVFVISRMK